MTNGSLEIKKKYDNNEKNVEKEQKHKYGVYTSAISSIQKTFPRIDQSSRNSRENHKLCHTVMILLPPHY